MAASSFKSDPPIWLEDHQVAQTMFDAADADIALQCAPLKTSAADAMTSIGPLASQPQPAELEKLTPVVYKAHRSRLAAASTFFENMQTDAVPDTEGNTSKEQALPVLVLEENWLVVLFLLGHAYNRADILAPLRKAPWQTLLLVYNAANKYCFQNAVLSTSCLLKLVSIHPRDYWSFPTDYPSRLSVSTMNADASLQVYIRASIFDDEILYMAVESKAAEVPLKSFTAQDLQELPTVNLMKLVCPFIAILVHAETGKSMASCLQIKIQSDRIQKSADAIYNNANHGFLYYKENAAAIKKIIGSIPDLPEASLTSTPPLGW